MNEEPWLDLLGSDPRPWLLESDEPTARWVVLTQLLDRPADDPDVVLTHAAVLEDPGTADLIGRLGHWGDDTGASGHHSPNYQPNLLQLLADMGVGHGDHPDVDQMVEAMLGRHDQAGHFEAFGKVRGIAGPVWSSLLCDTHVITEVLIRFGFRDHPAVAGAVGRMSDDLSETEQGRAWPCIPDPVGHFRGPGRKNDFCPQVTLEALRTLARLPEKRQPPQLLEVARVAVGAWRNRLVEKPYMFGHGYRFKTVKWPAFWYDLHWVLDTLGRYPPLWTGPTSEVADRRALVEMLACLVSYNFDVSGRVTPRSCYKGFEAFSFGQKKRPSPFATARLAAVVRRFGDLATEAAGVDVHTLGSSKGGSGVPVAPKSRAGADHQATHLRSG